MGVNGNKRASIRTLAAAKEQSRPSCCISARPRREEPALGWMPNRMRIRKLPSSSTKTFFR
jgi:hypothetical protein